MIRVLHVVTSLEQGGMENGICNVARAIVDRGFQTSVACLERSGPFAARLPARSAVEVLGKTEGFAVRAVFKLWRLLRRTRPDVVHTHNLGPLIYTSLATFGGRLRPIVHGEHSQLAPWELAPRRVAQRRRLYRACREVHTVSEAQREELKRLGLADRRAIHAIPNGVDTTVFRPGDKLRSRALLGVPANSPIIGVVARYGAHKGHSKVLEAFRQVAMADPRATLVFIGAGGPEEDKVTREVKDHPAREQIFQAGFRADLHECYPALDLLLIASTNEGMSNVALESMACAVPVLANLGTGNEGMIEHGRDGWLADLHSPALIAEALLSRLGDSAALSQAGENARRAVESRFSLGQMVAAYEHLYRLAAK